MSVSRNLQLAGMLATNEARRFGIATHIDQMSRYAEIIARELGMSASRARLLRGAAKLHDFGKLATPVQIAEGDLVVSHITGRGVHEGELLGIPPTNRLVETEGIAIHRVRDGKLVEFWAVSDVVRALQQMGVLPEPPA
jgi:predicted ester cyclase